MADKSFGVKELNLLNASGTPTITSPNNLNLNANTVAISTSVTVGQNLTVSANAGIASLNVTGIATIAQPADGNPMANWTITNNSNSAYRFTGPGQSGSDDNPDLYLVRGHRYIFKHNATSSHPIQIRVSNGGTAYTDGITYSEGDNTTTDGNNLTINLQHDAPAQLYYQCTAHGGMVGNIYTVGGPQVISGVVTATTFSGSGASLTNLPAANLTGTINEARISTLTATKLSGALPAISGANLTSLPAQATIANNADNRVITGGSGVNLNGESNFTWTGSALQVTAGTGNQFPFNLRNDFTPNSQRSDLLYAFNATSNNVLRIGSINSNAGITLQSTRANDSSVKHNLLLNPDGGDVSIGGVSPSSSALTVKMATNKHIGFSPSQGEVGDVPALVAFQDNGSLASIGFRGTDVRFAAGSTEVLRIADNAKVGINRTNPSSLLHIQTTDTTTYNISTAQTNGILTLGGNNGGASGRCVGLQFNGTASNGEAFITLVSESSTEANLHFGMRSGGSRGDRLRISRGGDIGAPSGNNIYNASDERLKENMIELTDGLSKIEKLKPISFNWKDGWNKSLDGITQYGFGAQTTQVVDEKLVEPFGTGDVELNGETIENPLRVNEKYIIPLLVKAVQELSAKVAALEGS